MPTVKGVCIMENTEKGKGVLAFIEEWAGYISRFIGMVQGFFADLEKLF